MRLSHKRSETIQFAIYNLMFIVEDGIGHYIGLDYNTSTTMIYLDHVK
jgi:hypothetical protein